MGTTIQKSSNWAISGGASAGLVPVAGITAVAVTLFDVDDQMFYPGFLGGSSVGAGLKAGGAISTFSPTFFTVGKPMYATDFDNSLCGLIDASLTILIGGSLTYLNIYGVDHTPSLLDLGGLNAGLSAGITLSPLMYLYVSEKNRYKNTGCHIGKADPYCGGNSNKGPNQSQSENQSKAANQSN